MVHLIVISVMLLGIALIVMGSKDRLNHNTLLKAFALVLFVVFSAGLIQRHAIDGSFNLFGFDTDTTDYGYYPDTWIFSVGKSFVIIMLRWLTLFLATWAIACGIKPHRFIEKLVAFVGVPLSILNVIFLETHIIAAVGEFDTYANFQAIQIIASITLIGIVSGVLFVKNVRTLSFNRRALLMGLGVVGLTMFAVMPQGLLFNFFGYLGEDPVDFTPIHIIVIVFTFVVMILGYVIMRNRSMRAKEIMLIFFVLASYFQFFYLRRSGLSGLPLHLCNTAVILMLFGFIFRWQSFFYFTYFANVIGALAAIMVPDFNRDFTDLRTIHFGYNHMYAFVIPIWGVALHYFKRPRLQQMLKALAIFSVYFVAMIIFNPLVDNFDISTNYFFTYSDHLPDMFGVRWIFYDYVETVEVFGLSLTFYPVFQVVYFFGFIFLMFMFWLIYDTLFQTFDNMQALKRKQYDLREQRKQLKVALGGRKFTEPINPGGTDMITIKDFSKRYGNAKDKAVENFSLTVKAGDVFGFLGHNGAGKSTTIKCMVGIQSITEGDIEICGYSIRSQPMQAKRMMGFVSDNHAVYERLTGREYVHYVAELYKVSEGDRDARLARYSEDFNLAHAIDREIKSYSHGMKQKLVVIASLIHNPRVWVLDEPLTGLDPTSAWQIKETMRKHAEKGNIVFFSSHVIEVVERICNKIGIINRGKLLGVYNMDDLRGKNIALEDLYMESKPLDI